MKILISLLLLAAIQVNGASIWYQSQVDGNDSDSGATWALAKATLAGALAVAVAGDTIYIDSAGAETQASAMTLTPAGTAASRVRILCAVRASGEPPTTLATTCTCATTGNSSIAPSGFAYVYGVTLKLGSGAVAPNFNFTSASPWAWKMVSGGLQFVATGNCQLNVGGTGTTTDDQLLELINCTVTFAGVGQFIRNQCTMKWRGGSIAGTAPTYLFEPAVSGNNADAYVSGVDFSNMGSTKTLVYSGFGNMNKYVFMNCKTASGVTNSIQGIVAGQGGTDTLFVNCDSADTNYKYYHQTYPGVETDNEVIVRTGGASDGTTPISHKIVTTANSGFDFPLESGEIVLWNETTTAQTLYIYTVSAVRHTDADSWIRIEYLATSGFPQSVFAMDSAADIIATPANQDSDTSAWDTGSLSARANSTAYVVGDVVKLASNTGRVFFCTTAGTTSGSEPGGYASAVDGDTVTDNTAVFTAGWRQILSKQITASKKGPIRVRVIEARPSTTLYFDPKVVITVP